jgi:single-strand DNA-binding protein
MFRIAQQLMRNSCTNSTVIRRTVTNDFSEKSVNNVTLLGRVGVTPQMRGTDANPVVIFTMATNTHFRRDEQFAQKTEWHKISVFKPYLRDTVAQYLKKGSRVMVQGKIVYGEVTDAKGSNHQTTTIVADEVIFVGNSRSDEIATQTEEQDHQYHA